MDTWAQKLLPKALLIIAPVSSSATASIVAPFWIKQQFPIVTYQCQLTLCIWCLPSSPIQILDGHHNMKPITQQKINHPLLAGEKRRIGVKRECKIDVSSTEISDATLYVLYSAAIVNHPNSLPARQKHLLLIERSHISEVDAVAENKAPEMSFYQTSIPNNLWRDKKKLKERKIWFAKKKGKIWIEIKIFINSNAWGAFEAKLCTSKKNRFNFAFIWGSTLHHSRTNPRPILLNFLHQFAQGWFFLVSYSLYLIFHIWLWNCQSRNWSLYESFSFQFSVVFLVIHCYGRGFAAIVSLGNRKFSSSRLEWKWTSI